MQTEIKKEETKVDEPEKKEPEKEVPAKADNATSDTTQANAETSQPPEDTASANPQVNETPAVGNGIRVEDIVTKDDLKIALDSLSAKLDAIIKENTDLKAANEHIRQKYEDNGDFGGEQKQGLDTKQRSANETFAEYSKQFM